MTASLGEVPDALLPFLPSKEEQQRFLELRQEHSQPHRDPAPRFDMRRMISSSTPREWVWEPSLWRASPTVRTAWREVQADFAGAKPRLVD